MIAYTRLENVWAILCEHNEKVFILYLMKVEPVDGTSEMRSC